ncbi:hypothetical protein MASR2M15_02520 [Anaerolineales bacterium]
MAFNDILSEYIRMRQNNMEANEALRTLRPYIDGLSRQDKEELAHSLWQLENQHAEAQEAPKKKVKKTQSMENASANTTSSIIRRLDKSKIQDSPPPVDQGIDGITWISCANCGRKNHVTDVFCYSCGHILNEARGRFQTQVFSDASDESHNTDYFGPDSILLLMDRETDEIIQLRPQNSEHEIVLGRGADDSAIKPEIDLTYIGAQDKGVSRIHLAISYIKQDNAIQVHDLGSANGTFINGQKLHPKENRVLRNGDEIRLARLVMKVRFLHPGQQLR